MKRIIFLIPCLFFLVNVYSESLGYDLFVWKKKPECLQGKGPRSYKDLIFVCTMPSSGTNVTLGILTYLTERPVFWSGDNWNRGIYHNRFNGPLNWDVPPILGTHNLNPFHTISKTENTFIITVRNYKDRYFRGKNKNAFNQNDYQQYLNDYLARLAVFDKWDPEKRLIVYYEDLIENPLPVVHDIAFLVKADGEKLEDVLGNYDEYRQRVLTSYLGQGGRSKTKGEGTGVHIQNVPKEILERADAVTEQANPYLFEKYLKRYLET